MNKWIPAALVSAVLGSLIAPCAMADGPALAKAARVTVHYGDLDLQTASGRQALEQRLARAARNLCTGGSSRDLEKWSADRKCVEQTVGRARAGIVEQQMARAAKGQASPG